MHLTIGICEFGNYIYQDTLEEKIYHPFFCIVFIHRLLLTLITLDYQSKKRYGALNLSLNK